MRTYYDTREVVKTNQKLDQSNWRFLVLAQASVMTI